MASVQCQAAALSSHLLGVRLASAPTRPMWSRGRRFGIPFEVVLIGVACLAAGVGILAAVLITGVWRWQLSRRPRCGACGGRQCVC